MTFFEQLKQQIKDSYEQGVSIEEAEKLAGKFLSAGIEVGEQLKVVDLDRRMKKSGLKAIRAAAYLEAASQGDKKPSDKLIEAVIDSNKVVNDSQSLYDQAEVEVNELNNLLSVFHEAHIFYRGVSKGRYE